VGAITSLDRRLRSTTWIPKVIMSGGAGLLAFGAYRIVRTCRRERPDVADELLRASVEDGTYGRLADQRWGSLPPADRCREELRFAARRSIGGGGLAGLSLRPRLAQLYLNSKTTSEALTQLFLDGREGHLGETALGVSLQILHDLLDAIEDPTVRLLTEMQTWAAVVNAMPQNEAALVRRHAMKELLSRWASDASLNLRPGTDQTVATQCMEWLLIDESDYVSSLPRRDLSRLFPTWQFTSRQLEALQALLNASQPGGLQAALVEATLKTLRDYGDEASGETYATHGLLDALLAAGAAADRVTPLRALLPSQTPIAPPAPVVTQSTL
jgi:hypothetical protein